LKRPGTERDIRDTASALHFPARPDREIRNITTNVLDVQAVKPRDDVSIGTGHVRDCLPGKSKKQDMAMFDRTIARRRRIVKCLLSDILRAQDPTWTVSVLARSLEWGRMQVPGEDS